MRSKIPASPTCNFVDALLATSREVEARKTNPGMDSCSALYRIMHCLPGFAAARSKYCTPAGPNAFTFAVLPLVYKVPDADIKTAFGGDNLMSASTMGCLLSNRIQAPSGSSKLLSAVRSSLASLQYSSRSLSSPGDTV